MKKSCSLICSVFLLLLLVGWGAHGSVVGGGTMLQIGRSRVRVPMSSLDFFNLPNPSSRPMALGFTKPLREMNTRNLPRSNGRPAREADTHTAICEQIV
jgi:hypothetical protein